MVEYLDDYDEAKTVPAHIAGLLLELDLSSGWTYPWAGLLLELDLSSGRTAPQAGVLSEWDSPSGGTSPWVSGYIKNLIFKVYLHWNSFLISSDTTTI